MRPLLALAVPTYDDYRGLSMTLQSLGVHQKNSIPVTVFDNFGECKGTTAFCSNDKGMKYVVDTKVKSTAYAKDRAISETDADFVLVTDSHVMLNVEGLDALKKYLATLPKDCKDIFHGCLVDWKNKITATELKPTWSNGMWGQWFDRTEGGKKALPEEGFEIFAHGGGCFCVSKLAWPGFHPRCSGFGGEEGAIQEQIRARGGRAITLPFLRWTHSFNDKAGSKHLIYSRDKFRNYLLNLTGTPKALKSWSECITHFSDHLSMKEIKEIVAECLPHGVAIKASMELVVQ